MTYNYQVCKSRRQIFIATVMCKIQESNYGVEVASTKRHKKCKPQYL